MKLTQLLRVLLLGAGVVLLAPVAVAAPQAADKLQTWESLPLRGVHAVAFVIDGLDDDGLSPYGLSRSGLLAGVAERLRHAGLEVVDPAALPDRSDAALLSLHVRLMRAPYYFYLYNVRLALRSRLPLAQDAGAYTTIETWSEGSVGEVQPTSLGTLSDYSLLLVDRFIAAHAAQNPG
jgi:hypothetical protein